MLVPKPHGDLDSLLARHRPRQRRRASRTIADPVLDPIHFGFTASLMRYAELRRARPDVEILMGTGNLTELTDADSRRRHGGAARHLLRAADPQCARRAGQPAHAAHDRGARRGAAADVSRARRTRACPKGYGNRLLSLHDMQPFRTRPSEIASRGAQVRDANFRIEAAADGIHIYNRDGHHVGAAMRCRCSTSSAWRATARTPSISAPS